MKEPLAYQTMFRFLDERFRRFPSEALGGLLGELQLDSTGQPFDAAVLADWDRAVAAAKPQALSTQDAEPLRRVS